MRIVDVCEFYSPTGGGVRSYVDRKMRLLAELGHELIVLAPGEEDRTEFREGGGMIRWVKAPPLPFDANYRMFWDAAPIHAELDRLAPDIVEASSPWRPAWIVGRWQGTAAKVFFLHSDPVTSYPQRWFGRMASRERIDAAFDWFNAYLRRALPLFDSLVVCGASLERRFAERRVGPARCIALGIDRAAFSPQHRDEQVRSRLLAQCGLPDDATLLLGIGRHHPEKRWGLVIDAVQAAAARTPLGLILIGKGPASSALRKQIGANPHIRLFEPIYDRPQLATLLASADALIHGCEGETFGLVGSEALASGLPLIVPDEGGCADIALPAYAELYTARDAASAASSILRFCARDRASVSAAAREAAAGVRSDRDHVADLLVHYQALLAVPRRAAA